MRRAGDARVVHFVETLHGLVAVVLSALEQVTHGHGAAVVVDVVAALAVGEDLDALDEAGGVSGLLPSVFLTRKAILMDSGSMKDVPLVNGMRQTLEVVGEKELSDGEELRVMPHVAGVACFELVVQALHQLILGSGGDYLHACLFARILTRTAKENAIPRKKIAFCSAKPCKCY